MKTKIVVVFCLTVVCLFVAILTSMPAALAQVPQYYTKSEADSRFVNASGDKVNGSASGGLLSVTNNNADGAGVAGYCYAINGNGVFGQGALNGIHGYSSSPGSVRGVYGEAANKGNYENYGGYFVSKGYNGYGVYGEAPGASGEGVHGEASGKYGRAVVGEATYIGGTTVYGGHFTAHSSNGRGVYGESKGETGRGVFGWAKAAGSGDENYGGYFFADGGKGKGVYGKATNKSNVYNYGGYFIADGTQGTGVFGEAPKEGVYGRAYASAGIGVNGLSTGKTGKGVSGYALNKGDVVNYGGHFVAVGKKGIGVYGKGFGYAGYFDGDVSVKVLEIKGGSDLSEKFNFGGLGKHQRPLPGTVVSIDPENPGDLMISRKAYDRKVAGIVSGAGGVKPGMLMGQEGTVADGFSPVALTGRVYCRTVATNGPIEPGNLLTTSDTPGHAMKATDYSRSQGAILGKAMTSLEKGTGLVLVLVSLQ